MKSYEMNDAQDARFVAINDSYGVEEYELIEGEVHFEDESGDRGVIHKDGTVTWKSGALAEEEN